MVMTILKTIFQLLLVLSYGLALFDNNKNEKKTTSKKEEEKTTKLETIVSTIIVLVTLGTFIGGIIFVLTKHQKLIWIFTIISIPVYLSYITGTYESVSILRKVVHTNKKEKLSTKEYWAIDMISYGFFLVTALNIPSKLMTYIKGLESATVSDFLYITLYIIFNFAYIFFICALSSRPLKSFSKLALKLNLILKNKTKFKLGDFFINGIDKNNFRRPLLVKIIEKTKQSRNLLHVLVWILSPIFIALDICLTISRILGSFLIETIGYVVLLLRMIKTTIGKIVVYINNLSDRRFVATSFRIALILTLALTVVTNRYSPLFKLYDPSTAVLEFISSTILIPVIFEWIGSVRRKNPNNKNQKKQLAHK